MQVEGDEDLGDKGKEEPKEEEKKTEEKKLEKPEKHEYGFSANLDEEGIIDDWLSTIFSNQ